MKAVKKQKEIIYEEAIHKAKAKQARTKQLLQKDEAELWQKEEPYTCKRPFPDYNTERRQEWTRETQVGRKNWEMIIVGLALVSIVLVALGR